MSLYEGNTCGLLETNRGSDKQIINFSTLKQVIQTLFISSIFNTNASAKRQKWQRYDISIFYRSVFVAF